MTCSSWAIDKDNEGIEHDGLTSAGISNSWPSGGAGVSSHGVTSSVGPVAVERGYTGTDSCSNLGEGRLGGDTGGEGDCFGVTGGAGLGSDRGGPGNSSQGVTSSIGPVITLRGGEDGEIEVDEKDL